MTEFEVSEWRVFNSSLREKKEEVMVTVETIGSEK